MMPGARRRAIADPGSQPSNERHRDDDERKTERGKLEEATEEFLARLAAEHRSDHDEGEP